ncbi:hypothetical protein DICPUDRAFT_159234 [Dictyostelium purpureum]|uniref:Golgi SNAP receptor complex member 1 n=1 Tax=Dictyostelium purpureum TaxID=5786 RepID=F1A3L9_DICPU|nr:uncharacterized protein DICPUDRAFT_159234 [Dictyostelium purpureum]EGC29208.1 hypothetical protein DICPUDRAFT_159234 [Dictyostelium purpureum]|eukprot:XP_003294266.1 hypothetical protein DICPUDRAFT_159234 [Dictyostelium purpureum]
MTSRWDQQQQVQQQPLLNGSLNSLSTNLDNLKKERRKLESYIDGKLNQLSTLNDKVQRDDENVDIEYSKIDLSDLTSELDSAFKNLQRCNELLVDDPNFSSNKEHKEKLDDYLIEYRKLKKNIITTLERSELLEGSTYNKNKDTEIPMTNLLREHSSLQNSSYLTDSILGQARQAHEALENQRRILRGASSKITSMPNLFQTIDGVTSKIKRYKQRNVVIIGLLIGGLICFLLYYSFKK